MLKKGLYVVLALLILALVVVGCGKKETPTPTPVPTPVQEVKPTEEKKAEEPKDTTQVAIAAMQKGGCGACHVIPGVPNAQGTIGPDLSKMGVIAGERIKDPNYKGKAKTAAGYLRESLVDPNAYIVPECPGGACQEGMMPAFKGTLSDEEINAIVDYLLNLKEGAQAPTPSSQEVAAAPEEGPPPLTEEEFAKAKKIYFDRCAGCHGVLRKGATGPSLEPENTRKKGTAALAAIIYAGTPRGMPDWGKSGVLTKEETELMAKFIQHEPPAPPEMSMQQMKEFWKVIVPPEERPDKPQHNRNWQNFFSVTLRDAGQVAIIDGDTYEVVNKVDTGYAVHISRMSKSGRYVYTIGRDGKVTLIDLWLEKPDKVAEGKVCYDARSVDTSKFEGYEDKYAIVGCYWPPHFVILDGATLEPIKVVSTRSYTYDTEEYHPEPRVASIVASHARPQWVVNVKETGQVWLVDYSDPNNPTIKMLEAERFLHDGGWAMKWDGTERVGLSPYFLVAANMKNKVVVVNTEEEKIEAIVETGTKPHPGRGANWVHPEYGPVWATGHLGSPNISIIGVDPENYPQYAWKVVAQVELPAAGNLFIKTHPKSKWLWVDFPITNDPKMQRSVCVIDKNTLEVAKCWEVADYGRAVHFEYNQDGTEVWVSVWGKKDAPPDQQGEIVVYNDETLEEVTRIKGLVTPTGKFNVYNTQNDIY